MPSGKLVHNLLMKSVTCLLELGLIRDVRGFECTPLKKGVELLDVSGSPELRGVQSNSGTVDEYFELLANSAYGFLFSDYAFVQISAAFENNDITWYRYVYYPCPLVVEDWEEEDLLSVYGVFGDGIMSSVRLRSCVRFEYAPDDAHVYHPPSHVHIVDETTRMGVGKVLSVCSFLRFVLETFYRPSWSSIETIWSGFAADSDSPLEEVDKKRLCVY